MGKKMKLPLPFKSTETSSSSSSLWLWGTCNHPKTQSFRANNGSDIFKTMNTVYINNPASSYSSISSKTTLKENGNGGCCDDGDEELETVIKGLSSERFFCEVTGETSSILEEANSKKGDNGDGSVALFKESVAMEMESRDPFVDFRRSMEEMMEANQGSSLKENWDFVENLLTCYLKVNHKSNHVYIVGAFVDLLVGLQFASATNTDSLSPSTSSEDQCCCSSSSIGGGGNGAAGHSFTSPLSFYSSTSSTSPCLSSLMESEDEIEKSEENASKSSLILTHV